MARDGKELRCASRDDRCEVAVYVVECLIRSGAVEVIEPQNLRDMVADEVMQMYKMYK